MKRILFLLIVLLSTYSTIAQEQQYLLEIEGYIHRNRRTDCGPNGLQYIQLYFENGQKHYVLGDGSLENSRSEVNYTATPYIFSANNRVTRIEFYSIPWKRGGGPVSGKCQRLNEDQEFINMPNLLGCWERTYQSSEIYPQHEFDGRTGSADVTITPIPNLTFSDNTDPSIINTVCTDESIGINSSISPSPQSQWEFFDTQNKDLVTHPDLKILEDELDRLEEGLNSCTDLGCALDFQAKIQAIKTKIAAFNRPRKVLVDNPKWKPLLDIASTQQSISIGLKNLYTDTEQQNKAIGENLQVRLNYSCEGELLSEKPIFGPLKAELLKSVSFQFLPAPPVFVDEPDIEEPKCADDSAEITLFFNRQLKDGEEIQINLLKDEQSIDNNVINGSNTKFIGIQPGLFGYNFKRNSSTLINTGKNYEVVVTGFDSTRGLPSCEGNRWPFEVQNPAPVEFDANVPFKVCYGKKDGVIQGNVSGGTDSYQYHLGDNNWKNLNVAPSRVFSISLLTPAKYELFIRDTNNCEADKSISLEIIENTTVTPNMGDTVQPSGSTAEDGVISINTVSGGTPFNDINGNYYEYTITKKGDNANPTKERVYASGTRLNGLGVGEYTIIFFDELGCKTPIPVIKLEALEAITFEVNKKDPSCYDATDGEMTVDNIQQGSGDYTIIWQKTDENGTNIGPAITAPSIPGGRTDIFKVTVTDNNDPRRTTPEEDLSFENVPEQIQITKVEIAQEIQCSDGKAILEVQLDPALVVDEYEYGINNNGTFTWQDSPRFEVEYSRAGYQFQVRRKANPDCQSLRSDRIQIQAPPLPIGLVRDPIITDNTVYGGTTGKIEITPQGGTPGSGGYTIEWTKLDDPSFNRLGGTVIENLASGNYAVTISDGNCTPFTRDNIYVDQPVKPIALSVEPVNILCSETNETDGKIKLTPDGGTPPYFYSIDDQNTYIPLASLTDNTITGLSGEITYRIWLRDDQGRTIDEAKEARIEIPERLQITEDQVSAITLVGGNNGKIEITKIEGGNGNYSYTWTKDGEPTFSRSGNVIDQLSRGVYTVIIRYLDDPEVCETSKEYPLNDPEPLDLGDIEVVENITCFDGANGELKITPSGGYVSESGEVRYTYQWYKINPDNTETPINTDFSLSAIPGLSHGVYKVVVKDEGGNEDERTHTLENPKELRVTLAGVDTPIVDVTCFGKNTGSIDITVTPNTGATYTFIWTKNNDPNFTWNEEDLINAPAGTYNVTVMNGACSSEPLTGLTIDSPKEAIRIYDVEITGLNGFETNDGSIAVKVEGGTPPYTFAWTSQEDDTFSRTTQDIDKLPKGNYTLLVTDANKCEKYLKDQEVGQPEELKVTINELPDADKTLCFGETSKSPLTATVEGGSIGDKTYTWTKKEDPDFESFDIELLNPSAGEYTLTVKDPKGNSDSDTYSIGTYEELTIKTTITPSCYQEANGMIQLLVTGGKPGEIYSYTWSNGEDSRDISGLSGDTYSVTVKSGDCEKTFTDITIPEPESPIRIEEPKKTLPTANGGSNGKIEVTVDGDLSEDEYTYSWTDIDDNLLPATSTILEDIKAGTYYLVISYAVTEQATCSSEKFEFVLGEPDPIEITITEEIAINCYGETGTLKAEVKGGIEPYTYQWKDDDGNDLGTQAIQPDLAGGNYSVEITDANGNGITVPSEVYFLEEPEALQITNMLTTPVTCFGDTDGKITITVEGGVAPYTYFYNGQETSSNEIENLRTDIAYTIRVEDDKGCSFSYPNLVKIPSPEAFKISRVAIERPSSDQTADGKIEIEITGGVAPYTYNWKKINLQSNEEEALPGAGGTTDSPISLIDQLSEAKYMLSVDDANGNCVINDEFNLSNPGELLVDIEKNQDISCFNGSDGVLSAEPVGGVGGNQFQWYQVIDSEAVILIGETNKEIRNLPKGEYYVIVSNGENTTEKSRPITLEEPQPIVAAVSKKEDVGCFEGTDGSIELSAQGGNGIFEYRIKRTNQNYGDWILFISGETTVISALVADTYQIQVRDTNGCTFDQLGETKTIVQEIGTPRPLQIQSSYKKDPTGFNLSNGEIGVVLEGGTGNYTYKWYDKNGNLRGEKATIENLEDGNYTLVYSDENECSDEQSFDLIQPEALEIVSLIQSNVILCYGDTTASLRVTSTGGKGEHTYTWYDVTAPENPISESNPLTGVGAGDYYVVVKDGNGNEIKSDPKKIEQPKPLQVELKTDYQNCGDGNDWSIEAVVQGGNGGYTYLWNTGATTASLENVTPNATYTLMVRDSKGCQSEEVSVVIDTPKELLINYEVKIPTCVGGNDGSITLALENGVAPYQITWQNGLTDSSITQLKAGEYKVTVIDNKGCEKATTIKIEDPEPIIVELGKDITLCLGQSALLDATLEEDEGATYYWQKGAAYFADTAQIEVDETDIYSVQITTSNGCIVTDEIFIEATDRVIAADFAMSNQVFTNQKFVAVNLSSPVPDISEWLVPEGASLVGSDDNHVELYFDTPGEYEITLHNTFGLCETSKTKTVVVIDKSIDPDNEDINADGYVQTNSYLEYILYPNPTKDKRFTLDISLPEKEAVEVRIFSTVNNQMITNKKDIGKKEYQFIFDLLNTVPGVYFVVLETKSQNKVLKLILN